MIVMRNALLVLALAIAAPSSARATVDDGFNYVIGSVAIGVPYLAVSAILIGEGLDDAIGRGHGLAEAGAIFEIVWASLHLSAGIPLLIAASVVCANGCSDAPPIPAMFAVGALLFTVGAAYLAHGIWSLTGGRPPPVTAALVPLDGGAVASARFEI